MERPRSLREQRYEAAQRVVDDLLRRLPEDVRRHAETLGLELDDMPSRALRRSGIPGDLLGLFRGYPLRGPAGQGLEETTVSLFLENIWREAEGHWGRFREEVRKTYLHELGHYLGLDEDDLDQRHL